MDLIDFAMAGAGILVLLVALAFIVIIWSAAAGAPVI